MSTILEKAIQTISIKELQQLQVSIGLWINGKSYWLNDQSEKIISEQQMSIRIKEIQLPSNVRLSQIFVSNHDKVDKEIKLLITHRYSLATRDHLSFVSPSEQVIYHLANNKVFLVNGQCEGQSMQQATIQPLWNINSEQFWSCPTKGILKYQPMVKGLAASMFTLNLQIRRQETKKAMIWAVQGDSKNELGKINESFLKTH